MMYPFAKGERGRGGGLVYLSIDFVCFLFHLPTLCGPEKPPLLLLLHVFFVLLLSAFDLRKTSEPRVRESERGR